MTKVTIRCRQLRFVPLLSIANLLLFPLDTKVFPVPMPHRLRNRTVTVFAVLASFAASLVLVSTAPVSAQGPSCFGVPATIVARAGETTQGTSGRDVIVGTSGADVIKAKGGNDLICGGPGQDRIDAGGGADRVRGGTGHDTLFGGPGRDRLRGSRGNDEVRGEAGVDRCWGGRGSDSLRSCNEPPESALSGAESEMVALVDDLRSQCGAAPLDVNLDMASVARDWSSELPGAFAHNPDVGSMIPSGWWAWGENIAYNGSVVAAFTALVNSPGHFDNMVNPSFTDVGVGVIVENGRVYVTQVFARY